MTALWQNVFLLFLYPKILCIVPNFLSTEMFKFFAFVCMSQARLIIICLNTNRAPLGGSNTNMKNNKKYASNISSKTCFLFDITFLFQWYNENKTKVYWQLTQDEVNRKKLFKTLTLCCCSSTHKTKVGSVCKVGYDIISPQSTFVKYKQIH